jgi:DNA-binding transcriptional regulator YhcF (GntR family)
MATRALRIDPADAAPIWRQIEEGVRWLVASGALAPAAAVPSVRDLARDLRVNPATVAKAYQRLADAGVLAVRRGEGTFVSVSPPSLPRSERLRELDEAASRYASLAVTLGFSQEEALGQIRAALGQLERSTEGAQR